MTGVATIHELRPGPPPVTGYVEAFTADRVLGWAWSPVDPKVRVAIELRLSDRIVARAEADQPREDLTRSGIGDGRHAFALEIPPDCRARAEELTVHARAGDGPAVPIGAPPAADALDNRLTKLTRGMEMMLNAQRQIHRDLQTALAGRAETPGAAEAQAATAEQIAAVEQFVIRLDAHLAKLSGEPAERAPVPRAALCALGLSGAALSLSIAGLVQALLR